eukprot:m.68644 g.68644  ORF g.68644 m.68644 type:complete len:194 (+) comp23979_c1_seq1:1166-1747(+)
MKRPGDGILGYVAMALMANMNAPTIEDAIRRLDVADGDTVVEIGAGHGVGIRALSATGKNLDVWAIEISPAFREVLRTTTALPKDRIVDTDARSMEFLGDATVDKIVAVNVVYFLNPLPEYLRELLRVLKPGGMVLFGCKFDMVSSSAPPFINTNQSGVVDAMVSAGFEVEVVEVDLGGSRFNYQAVEGRKRA